MAMTINPMNRVAVSRRNPPPPRVPSSRLTSTITTHITRIGNHALLAVRLTPKAKEDAILGVEQFGSERVLKARVRAVPEQGCANEALERLIAKWLGLPPSSVAVVQGGKSRMKHVKTSGDGDRLAHLLAERVASLASSA